MDKLKKMILVHVPIKSCNLRCKYCYITIQGTWNEPAYTMDYSMDIVGKAFGKDRLGGVCFVNMCASGETLIPNNIVDVSKAILKQGHYLEIVTNGTLTKRFDSFRTLPKELLRRLSFKFSLHYLDLKRQDLLDVYAQNINKMRESGCSFTIELMPTDDLEPYIAEIKDYCMSNFGALCHCTIARNDVVKGTPVLSKHTLEEYIDIWSDFDSGMMKLKYQIFEKKRREFCYAGDWSLYINLYTGAMSKCYKYATKKNFYENLDSPLDFNAVGKCKEDHCYNGHALLAFGLIPDLKIATYAQVRNRVCEDGSQWYNENTKHFYNSKLVESNKEYNPIKKGFIYSKNTLAFAGENLIANIKLKTPGSIKNFVKKIIKTK